MNKTDEALMARCGAVALGGIAQAQELRLRQFEATPQVKLIGTDTRS